MKKNIIFYHEDLDGYASNYLLRNLLNKRREEYVSYKINYNYEVKALEALNKYDRNEIKVWFVDYCPDVESLEFLFANYEVQVIDHHKTNIHKKETYPELNITVETDGKLESGASLVLKLYNEEELNSNLKDLAEQVRSYDTWDWKKNDEILPYQLNLLFYRFKDSIFDKEKESEMMDSYFNNIDLLHWKEDELNFLEELEAKKKKVCKTFFDRRLKKTVMLNGKELTYSISVLYDRQFLSDIAEYIQKEDEEVDFCFFTDFKTGNLRSINDVDLTPLVTRLGGGGHPKACGFTITEEQKQSMIDSLGVL